MFLNNYRKGNTRRLLVILTKSEYTQPITDGSPINNETKMKLFRITVDNLYSFKMQLNATFNNVSQNLCNHISLHKKLENV